MENLDAPRPKLRPPGWLIAWVDCHVGLENADDDESIDWARCVPFIGMHIAAASAFLLGVSWPAVAAAVGLYLLRMFIITGFYHRYFSHRAFKTSRAFQYLVAVLGCTSLQGDPMWWAAHHFEHHANSDQDRDPHSPVRRGFWRSHVLWFMTRAALKTRSQYVRDWARYPELVALNRFDKWPGVALAFALFGLGKLLEVAAPEWGATGWQMLFWGFFLSTVVTYHATFTINSLAHQFGSKRFETGDHSRNNWLLALLTLGEGWHNNHHRYPGAARQGFYWWEVDLTYYGLVALEKLGLIWDLRPVPAKILEAGR